VHARRHTGGVELHLHLFLILALDVSVASPPGKLPSLPTELEAERVPEVVQTFRRSKKCLGPARNQTPDCPAHSFVNIVNAIPPPTLLLTENKCKATSTTIIITTIIIIMIIIIIIIIIIINCKWAVTRWQWI
jgi:hypothetical protein